jgi:hypothetical protein
MADQGFLESKKKRGNMVLKQYVTIPLFLIVVLLSGCAGSTTFRVLDAKTKQPIEGAVALAEWVGYKGTLGFSHSYTAGVAEDVSDSEGKLTISDDSGLGTPHLKVYKPGYAGWDSQLVYLGYYENNIKTARLEKRKDFFMKDQDIFLEPWDDKKHSYISHGKFISITVDFTDVGMTSSDSKYLKAIRYEAPLMDNEWYRLP